MLFAALPMVFSAEQFISPFWRWDPHYRLQIGNETTMNRPWLGKIYLAALYRRALSREEVVNNFTAGFAAVPLTGRTQKDLIALYEFAERGGNIVHDTASFGAPLDLKLLSSSRVRWLADSGGLEIAKRSIVRSQEPASKLVEALKETGELSVEVWIATHNTVQHGPARILSLSGDSGARNFTLGQQGADIHFRLRTPASGNNGTPVVLETTGGALKREASHVVVTYEQGIERLYMNGAQRPESVNLVTDAIIGFGTRKTPTAQIAYSFLYFFPVAFVFAAYFSRRSVGGPYRLYALAIAVGLCTATELVQAFAFERSVDVPIIGYGLMIGLVGGLSGYAFTGIERWL
jgi:Concanavalin A-like lectin/glucanases superfamily